MHVRARVIIGLIQPSMERNRDGYNNLMTEFSLRFELIIVGDSYYK